MYSARSRYKALVAAAALLLTTAPVLAGQYVLEKGKGVEVCEAYQKNLNAMIPYGYSAEAARKLQGTVDPAGMGYLRASHPNFPESAGFSRAKLERLVEFNPPPQALLKIDNFLWERDANPAYYMTEAQRRDWRGTPKQWEQVRPAYDDNRNRRLSVGHRVTRMDIDNDGALDNVYIDQPGSGSALLVLNADLSDVDREKTRLVTVHPSRKEQGAGLTRPVKKGDWGIPPIDIKRGYTFTEDSLHDAYYDLFRYKDKTYFDLWWSGHPDFKGKRDIEVGRLRVYTIEQKQTREVCVYRFDY